MRFGRLIAQEAATKNGHTAWLCLCDCGATHVVCTSHLRSGYSRSCGCLKAEIVAAGANTRHGMRHTKTYDSWCSLKGRCLNPNDSAFFKYGGRGIKVCVRWMLFENFLADMGACPDGKTIDRINNDGNYEPGNCRWATPKEQANNTRRNHILTLNGESMTIAQWAERIGETSYFIKNRIKYGWPVERILTEPKRIQGKG